MIKEIISKITTRSEAEKYENLLEKLSDTLLAPICQHKVALTLSDLGLLEKMIRNCVRSVQKFTTDRIIHDVDDVESRTVRKFKKPIIGSRTWTYELFEKRSSFLPMTSLLLQMCSYRHLSLKAAIQRDNLSTQSSTVYDNLGTSREHSHADTFEEQSQQPHQNLVISKNTFKCETKPYYEKGAEEDNSDIEFVGEIDNNEVKYVNLPVFSGFYHSIDAAYEFYAKGKMEKPEFLKLARHILRYYQTVYSVRKNGKYKFNFKKLPITEQHLHHQAKMKRRNKSPSRLDIGYLTFLHSGTYVCNYFKPIETSLKPPSEEDDRKLTPLEKEKQSTNRFISIHVKQDTFMALAREQTKTSFILSKHFYEEVENLNETLVGLQKYGFNDRTENLRRG